VTISLNSPRFGGHYQFVGSKPTVKSTVAKLHEEGTDRSQLLRDDLVLLMQQADARQDETPDGKQAAVIFKYKNKLIGISGKDAHEFMRFWESPRNKESMLWEVANASTSKITTYFDDDSDSELAEDYFQVNKLQPKNFPKIDLGDF